VADLATIYITANPKGAAAELRCTNHPEWWSDADGTNLPDAVRNATDHVRDDHHIHVDGCMCRWAQVIDQRCIPGIAPHGGASDSVATAINTLRDYQP
jgi:hypothetical protein